MKSIKQVIATIGGGKTSFASYGTGGGQVLIRILAIVIIALIINAGQHNFTRVLARDSVPASPGVDESKAEQAARVFHNTASGFTQDSCPNGRLQTYTVPSKYDKYYFWADARVDSQKDDKKHTSKVVFNSSICGTNTESVNGTGDAQVGSNCEWYQMRTGDTITFNGSIEDNSGFDYHWILTAAPPKEVKYKVEHYKENLSDSNYTLADTDELKTTPDNLRVTPSVKSYTGFTSPSTKTETISGDGTSVIKYYYTRNRYKLSVIVQVEGTSYPNGYTSYDGITFKVATSGRSSENETTGNVYTYSSTKYYETSYTISNISCPGFKFVGAETDKSGTIGASDVTVYLKFNPITYSVNLYGNKPSNATHEVTGHSPSGWTWSTDHYTKTFTYTKTENIPGLTSTYTLVGWDTQDGWYNVSSGGNSSNKVSPGNNEWNFTKTDGANINLYMYWTANTYTVRFNGNEHWNTSQDVYTQTLTYDSSESLIGNRYSRTAPYTVNSREMQGGYTFIGWGTSRNQSTVSYNDRQSDTKFNMTTTNNGTVDLYALWEKDIKLTFNLNGGTLNGSIDNIVLEGTVYNSTYDYTFNIVNDKTAANLPRYTGQIGTIDAYGEVINNGLNKIYKKTSPTGVAYRFTGWSLSSTANEPLETLCPYNSSRLSTYMVHDNVTLYAVWEQVLDITLKLDRKLGTLPFDDTSGVVTKNTITGMTETNPAQSEKYLNVIIKPGEEGYYTILTQNTGVRANVIFDTNITKIYDIPDKYTDSLNKKDEEALTNTQKHGLNRNIQIADNSTQRSFHMPVYIAERNTTDGNVQNKYAVKFKFSSPSFYYKYVFNRDEYIEVNGSIFITNKGGSTTDSNEPSGVLDELRTDIKMRIRN